MPLLLFFCPAGRNWADHKAKGLHSRLVGRKAKELHSLQGLGNRSPNRGWAAARSSYHRGHQGRENRKL
ncbi:hypothetical protein HYQ46_003400 [Verticillium longisporum]|nr:hypothetical protein HYQ46_003400 [Verticillium longisporum]